MRGCWHGAVVYGLLVAVVCGTATAQLAATHEAGVVVTVDFDSNGKDELVVVDNDMTAHTYTGLFGSPMLLPAGQTRLEGTRLLTAPVPVDRQLFTIHPGPNSLQFLVSTYFVQPGGGFQLLTTATLDAVVGPITSLRATALHRDLDGDRSRDLLIVWSESLAGDTRVFAMQFSRGVRLPPVAMGRPAGSPGDVRVVAVDRVATPSLQPFEFRVAYSASSRNPWGGFGFGLLRDGGIAGGSTWFPRLPSLLADEPGLEIEPVANGRFSPFPQFSTPVVKTFFGPSAVLGIDPTEPFVAPRGTFLRTSAQGIQLASCVADYDADDLDEMVWVEYLGPGPEPSLVVTDPGPARRTVVALPLVPWLTRPAFAVHHGATGDFDGDGDPDIVLSVRWQNGMSGSGLVYLLTERSPRHFRASFRRAQ